MLNHKALLIIMSMCSIFGASMFRDILITTVNHKVLQFLTKHSDKEFHEREIARRIGVATGSADPASNELYATGAIVSR